MSSALDVDSTAPKQEEEGTSAIKVGQNLKISTNCMLEQMNTCNAMKNVLMNAVQSSVKTHVLLMVLRQK